jgi:hypothetical protein
VILPPESRPQYLRGSAFVTQPFVDRVCGVHSRGIGAGWSAVNLRDSLDAGPGAAFDTLRRFRGEPALAPDRPSGAARRPGRAADLGSGAGALMARLMLPAP